MENINKYWIKLVSFFGSQMVKENYDKYCEKFNFVKCEKVGISADSKYDSLTYLLDHLFLFKAINDDKYYISNTYMTKEEIVDVLIKYNLVGNAFILGTGFWNNNTTAILFPYEVIENVKNKIRSDSFEKE